MIWPAEEDTEAISERRSWTCRRKAVSPHEPELLLLTKEVQVKDIGTCRFAWGFRSITLQGLNSRLGEAAWKEGDFNFLFLNVCRRFVCLTHQGLVVQG